LGVADRGVEPHEREDKKSLSQNIKARLEYGLTESSIMIVNGSMYAENEIASIPNVAAKNEYDHIVWWPHRRIALAPTL
jgi:hypothetical protein